MSDLPSGWETAPLSNVVISSVGGMWGSAAESEETTRVRVIRAAEFRDWAKARAQIAPPRFVPDSGLTSRRLEIGDVVLEVSGGGPTQPVGRTVLIDEQTMQLADLPLICSNFCRRLVLSDHLDPRFARYQLHHLYVLGDTDQYQRATTNIRNLQVPHYLEGTKLVIPPRAEQERIVAAIEEQFSRLDAGVAALERVRQNLKRMRRAALQGTVPDNPRSSWPKTRIDETVRIVDYRGRTPPFSPKGVPHLRSFNVKNGQVDWTGCTYVSDETYDKYMSRGFPAAGDLLFTTEAPMGEVAFAPTTKFCMAQRMMLLKPDPRLWVSEYLMYHLWSPWFQEHLRIHATGTTVQGISSRNFRPLQLWMPSLEEQERLATEIRQELALVASAEQSFAGQSKRTTRLRSAILAAAFSGKLVPQDPSDEAASFLLDRIAAERASSNGHKTTTAHKPRARRSKVLA